MTDWQPKISIVVPAHNEEERLDGFFQRLQKIEYPSEKWEFLLVDNGSADNTLKKARALGIEPLFEKKIGAYAARNTGVRRATGEVIAFTDADCLPEPGWLREGVRALANAELVSGQIEFFDEFPTLASRYSKTQWGQQEKTTKENQSAAAGNLFIRRAFFLELGGFLEENLYIEDTRFTSAATKKGARLVHAPLAIVRHPAHGTLKELLEKCRQFGFSLGESRRAAQTEWRDLLPGVRELVQFYHRAKLKKREVVPAAALIWMCKLAKARGQRDFTLGRRQR
ncbi:MAG: glycosyltransferase family 2 protein [Deltaproteobacteria bacterium]|nr:glycosyltransferase family 2 protein [Deltaproteobacteria bacterium]